MAYSLQIPGGTKTGPMGPFLAPPPKPLGLSGAQTKSIGDMSHCRQVRMTFPPCYIAPGEFPLSITAQAVAGGPTLTATDTTVFGPNPSSVTLDMSGAWEAGVPRAVNGHVTMACGSAAGAEVKLYAANAVHPVGAIAYGSGDFTTEPLVFTRGGADTLRALVASTDRIASSDAAVGVTVAPGVARATAVDEPRLIKLGAPTPFSVRIDFAKTGAPWAGVPVNISLYAASCTANTGPTGVAVCSITLPATYADKQNTTLTLSVGVPQAAPGPQLVGASPVLVAMANGLVSHTVPGWLSAPLIDGVRPAGVMLNNYNRKWSGTGAHLTNASMLYPGPTLANGRAFDIPTLNAGPVSYYVDRVFVRTGPIEFDAPARIRLPLSVTGADDGGRRLKGFCFTAYCRYTVGADDSAPDVTDIALSDSYVSLDFTVSDGKVKATLGPTAVSLDFSCGGISAAVCGTVRSYVNDKAREQITALYNSPALLDPLSANVDASVKHLLPNFGIASLTSLTFAADGSLTVTGTPLVK